MNNQIELQRNDVTLAEFFSYIKSQCAKKGIDFSLDRDDFENPVVQYNDSYHVKDGVKYVRVGGGPTQQWDGSDAPAQAEITRTKPLDYQVYVLLHDGTCYNEICEFTFDDGKRGHGYYYQMNRGAREQEIGQRDELFQADRERAEAQRGQELVSEVAVVPRGLDSNLHGADLSGAQETVLAASDRARTQVNDLRASAASRETALSTATDKITEARGIAKNHLGSGAILTSATPGRTYSGKIIGIIGGGPDKTAVQAISDNHAVLHDIKNISEKSNIRIGAEVNLTADERGYSASRSKAAENAEKRERAREGLKR